MDVNDVNDAVNHTMYTYNLVDGTTKNGLTKYIVNSTGIVFMALSGGCRVYYMPWFTYYSIAGKVYYRRWCIAGRQRRLARSRLLQHRLCHSDHP